MAGIQGTKKDGAYSVVISNHYKDDMDYGSAIIYTGAGTNLQMSTRRAAVSEKTCRWPPKVFRQGPNEADSFWAPDI